MNSLVIIPARGGSKGVPGKNIKHLAGQPLIHYTIKEALKVFPSSHILVSTDSEEIKSVSEECGIKVPFIRPESLAQDTSSSYDVIVHAVEFARAQGLEFDSIVLLQPTSPFRKANHIQGALDLYSDAVDMIVSVKEADSNPYYSLFEESSDGLLHKSKKGDFTRRQDCPKVYEYNGAVYVINPNSLKQQTLSEFENVRKYVMSPEDSLDIDTNLDWLVAEAVISQL